MEQDEIDELVAAYDGADPFALPETVVVSPLGRRSTEVRAKAHLERERAEERRCADAARLAGRPAPRPMHLKLVRRGSVE